MSPRLRAFVIFYLIQGDQIIISKIISEKLTDFLGYLRVLLCEHAFHNILPPAFLTPRNDYGKKIRFDQSQKTLNYCANHFSFAVQKQNTARLKNHDLPHSARSRLIYCFSLNIELAPCVVLRTACRFPTQYNVGSQDYQLER